MSPEAIDALLAAGATAEQLAAAMKADLLAERVTAERARVAKREANAERQRRKRARDMADVTHVTRDSALQSVTERDAPAPPPLAPQTPLNPTPSPEKDITSREALSGDWPRDGFIRFWLRYPRKKAKADAEKAYRKAERTAGLTFAVLMAGLDRLIESGPDPQFIPYPASWLNAGQWADEPDPAPRMTNGHSTPSLFNGRHASRNQPGRSGFDAVHAVLGRRLAECDREDSGGQQGDLDERADDSGVIDADWTATARH